ncbi:MAG: hypothetical protein FWG20_03460, partial [Candidatus Cloacimonetes bacterium]|nr:hypothetical protein [Candidatus Cloacimonadota bacterium]
SVKKFLEKNDWVGKDALRSEHRPNDVGHVSASQKAEGSVYLSFQRQACVPQLHEVHRYIL